MGRVLPKMRRWSKAGVSDVVGNLLILAITVILMSSLLLFVNQLPTPGERTSATLSGVLNQITGNEYFLNLTHQGGETLDAERTAIYVRVDGAAEPPALGAQGLRGNQISGPNPPNKGVGVQWTTGEIWSYVISAGLNSEVVVTVVDTGRNTVVWTGVLKAPVGQQAPLIQDVWADSIPDTTSRDDVQDGMSFVIFATIMDPDGDADLNPSTIWLDATSAGVSQLYPVSNVSGTYRFSHAAFYVAAGTYPNWDGRLFLVHATDDEGHETVASFFLTATASNVNFEYNFRFNSSKAPFNGSAPPGLHYSGQQGFQIYNRTQFDTYFYNGTAQQTRSFKTSESVTVIIASRVLTPSLVQNSFTMWSATGVPPTTVSPPTKTDAFTLADYVNGWYLYRYDFVLLTISPGRYPIEVRLTDSAGTNFIVNDAISVLTAGGTAAEYPVLTTYDENYVAQKLSFQASEKIGVKIRVENTNPAGTPNTLIMGDVVIRDYTSGVQIWRAPLNGYLASGPIGTLSPDGLYYKFTIDLSKADGDPWNPGANDYSLQIKALVDNTEEYYLVLQGQLEIISANKRPDIVVGLVETGSNAWGTRDLADYYLNDNFWTRTTIQGSPQGEGTGSTTGSQFNLVRFIDYNGDNSLDIAASASGLSADGRIHLYKRAFDASGNVVWARQTSLPRIPSTTGDPLDMAVGSLDSDGDPEIAVVYSGSVGYYNNNGTWGSPNAVGIKNATVTNGKFVRIVDLDGDGFNDLVVLTKTSTIVYWNAGTAYSIGFTGPTTVAIPGNLEANAVDVGALNGTGTGYRLVVGASDNNVWVTKQVTSATRGTLGYWKFSAGTTTGLKFVKLGNFDTTDALPEIMVGTTTTFKIYNHDWSQFGSTVTKWSGPDPPAYGDFNAAGVADIDGDGDDDIIFGTKAIGNPSTSYVLYYRNFANAGANWWVPPTNLPPVGAILAGQASGTGDILSLDLGDASNP